ncbi:hypothetical protein LTR57_010154 [Friedmanniomyces endolithicus]|nr:hypothetical protein LTR57_010154 [Friedmanniomyces endolithicus]KAK0966150.1 hypothetical protein LTS01_017997 [Friedmanniomyces endolithicus]
MKLILAAFKEWRIYGAWVMFWGNTIGTYGFTATVPSVIEELGYSAADAQLLTIPICKIGAACSGPRARNAVAAPSQFRFRPNTDDLLTLSG